MARGSESRLPQTANPKDLRARGDKKLSFESQLTAETVLLLRPDPQQPPQVHHLAQVIRVVVGDQQSFTHDRLAIAPWNLREQIRLWVLHQVRHGLQVRTKFLYAAVPRGSAGRSL